MGGGAEGRRWVTGGVWVGSRSVTVELEVRYWRESRAAGEQLTLVFTLCWEDVSAQVPTVVLGERRTGKWG